MGKPKKGKASGKKGRGKKSFLENQKKKRNEFQKKMSGKGKEVEEESSKPRKAFKFTNFSDEIASVDYSIVYQLAGTANLTQASDDLKTSVFRATFDHWRELNLTAEFTEIVIKLNRYTTLHQVIYSQSTIIEALREGLTASTALSVQPVLELIAGLATDLQQEFYPHLNTFLGILTGQTLKAKDASIIKWTLRCLAHLLKILWRPISGHLEEVYSSLKDLFELSQPDYIRYLGAETVAFLLRKAKDKRGFLQYILGQMAETTDPVAISKLLFESVKTVNQQFNSQLEPSLRTYIEVLPGQHNEILAHFYQFCCDHTTQEHFQPILDITLEVIDKNLQDSTVFLDCLNKVIVNKQGRLIKDVGKLLDFFKDIINRGCVSDEILACVTSVIEAYKLPKTEDDHKTAVGLVIENGFTVQQIMDFVAHFQAETVFESFVLKPYLGWIQRELGNNFEALSRHLADILTERNQVCEFGSDLENFHSSSLDLNLVPSLRKLKKDQMFPNLCISKLNMDSSPETIRRSLLICASIYPVDKHQVLENTAALIKQILSTQNHSMISVLPLSIQTVYSLSSKEKIVEYIDLDKLVSMFLEDPKALQTLDFGLTCESWRGECRLNQEVLDKLFTRLVSLLCEPSSTVRQLALHSLSLVLPNLGSRYTIAPEENYLSVQEIVETLLQAETTAETLQEYKNKMNLLQRVEAERLHHSFRSDERLVSLPLNFLLGCMYTNFTLLWSPLQALVAGYGNSVRRDIFWNVFGARLAAADKDIQSFLARIREGREVKETENKKRVDYIKYRNQLWSLLPRFSDVAEAKNRDLVTLFLDNYNNVEYKTIRGLSEDRNLAYAHREVINSTIHSLMAHLGIFAHFKDLKSMHRVGELRDMVDEFLCHRVAPVQKIALEILVAFKLKYLLPYKDNLLKLLEDKDFKTELVAFPLGVETSEIKSEHRNDLIPIILRILYGRLRAAKRGKKDGGKGAIMARRNLILHTLLDLSEDNIRYFMDLCFSELYTGSEIKNNDDVYTYIQSGGKAPVKSVKELQAHIEMIQAIIGKLGQLMETNLGYVLRTIVWIGYIVDELNKSSGKVVGFKAVRNSVYAKLSLFFSKFNGFEYTPIAEETIFKVFVWKPLSNFSCDYIHSASGLLQLVLGWSREPAYRRLLQVTDPDSGTRILENIVKVLPKSTTANKVVDAVLELVNNLVSPLDDAMETEEREAVEEVGIQVVLKEMDVLLDHFNSWIEASNKDVKQLKKVGVKLDILRHMAPHISRPEVALTFLNQLLVLLDSVKKPESITKVLVITQLLVEKVDAGSLGDVIDLVLPFFAKLESRPERIELSNFMAKIKEKDEKLSNLCDICMNLCAYDRKRFEEPDFEARMNQFISLRDQVRRKEALSDQEIKAAFYICCFSLRVDSDSSLKSNSLDTVLAICQAIRELGERDLEAARRIINKVCLDQVRQGLKSKVDSVRCDFVNLLQRLVIQCQDCNTRLKDLAKLSTPDDTDTDFFENIRHVQLHRRGRALTRLAKQIQDDPKFVSERNLTQLLIPVCTVYLLNPDYVKNSTLVEQAISFLGAVVRTLPWSNYENYIKYYISLFGKDTVPQQKQLVKITTEVLDAFHFSLDLQQEGVPDKEMEQRKKIHMIVNNSLLPSLTNTLSGKTKGPVAISDEDKLIQRVPLAVPIIKILQLNPPATLERAVPGIINKIASFLKSKAIEIREAARSTINSVMELLGPRFVSFVVRELVSFLTRGYQVHVLTFTVHNLLHNMAEKSLLEAGDLDTSVHMITEVALTEMFGVTAEEKEVKKITGKLLEAKNTKSYDTLQLTARFLSSSELMELVRPFADKLKTITAFKNVVKIKECLRNIVLGLLSNTALDVNFAMIFIYGVITDQIKLGRQLKEKAAKPAPVAVKNDSFIVMKAPKRGGAVAKTAISTSQHVIEEFGLNLLYFLLKRSSIDPANPEHCARLDPFFPVILEFLDSAHASVTTVALRCFQWFVKMPLKSKTDDNLLDLTNKVFGLLKRYGGGTDVKGENHDLVVMASKLLVVLIRDVKISQIKDEQLKFVFEYILVDVLDPHKQTTAFGLLSAVLSRKLVSPDLHDIMLKLVEMSITSNSSTVRQSAKAAVITYVGNYDLKKKLGGLVDLYLAQLGYEVEAGRLVAADAIKSIITTLGGGITSHAQFIFVSLVPHLINDESEVCRRAIASAVAALLSVLKEGGVDTLKRSVITWLKGENPAHAQLSCRILLIFVDTLGAKILKSELSLIEEKLPKFLQGSDSLCIQALSLLQRLIRNDTTNRFLKNSDINSGVHNCLLHTHSWVRLLAAQILGLHLTRLQEHKELDWLSSPETVKSVVLDSFEQLNLAESATAEISLQVIKNLVALTRLILARDLEDPSLGFVVKKAVKISNHELTTTPKVTVRRTLVFNFVAAVSLQASEKQVEGLLKLILPPLQREVSSGAPIPDLKTHAQEVLDLLKTRVDDETFSRHLMEVQLDITRKRGERNAAKKQNLILHPNVAAKRKLQQAEAKKNAKKARRMNK